MRMQTSRTSSERIAMWHKKGQTPKSNLSACCSSKQYDNYMCRYLWRQWRGTWVRLIIDYYTEPGFCHWDIQIRTENVNMYFHMLFFSTVNQATIQRTYQKASTPSCIYSAGLYCKGCTSPVSRKSVGSLQGQNPRHVVTAAQVRVFYYDSLPNITHRSFITEQFNSNTAHVSQ